MCEEVLAELMRPFNIDQALEEASRCLLCEDPPCEVGCPCHVPVREFIRSIRSRNFRGAYHQIKAANIFGASAARVCNSNATCKKHCTSEKLVRPIEIDRLQRFVCDMLVGDEPHIEVREPTGKKVAVLGAGPSGLSSAYELYRNGVETTVFEIEDFLGGILFSGIPSYRLPNWIVKKETAYFEKHGIKVIRGKKPPPIRELLNHYDACVIATGLTHSSLPRIPGTKLSGVFLAKEVLRAYKLGEAIDIGRKVVVVGGGNSALDAAMAAYALGVRDITILYRRTETEMPGWKREKEVARKLGVKMLCLAVPLKLQGGERVEALKCQFMEFTGEKSADGRNSVRGVEGAFFTIPADSVVFGIGEMVDSAFFKENKIELKPLCHQTSLDGVFCTGDLVSIEKTVVHSVASGRSCAKEVLGFLNETFIETARKYYRGKKEINLKTSFCGVSFENPFVLAAAPPTDDPDMIRDAFQKGWAGAVLKTTSIEGNPVCLKYPMMTGIEFSRKNLMGLGNIDLISEHHIDVVEKRVRALKKEFPGKVLIASIMGASKSDWQTLVRRLEDAGIDIIECSFSCPQGTLGSKPGFMLGQDPVLVKKVVGWIKKAARRVPVVIKITPQVTDIVEIARAVKEGGADAICASNSIPALMGVDLETFIPFPNVGGRSTYSGYTGAAIKPITLRTIAEIKRHVDIPITGTGGPINWSDAVELMAVGASNVQFCTAVMQYGFDIIDDLCGGLAYFMEKRGLNSPGEITGQALHHITTHNGLSQPSKIHSEIDQEKCIGCGDCVVACRDGGHRAISFNATDRRAEIDLEKCVGCSFCSSVCPIEGCITMKSQ